ncbi:MAG: hypothetical protein Q9181_003584 [Wetmoreana brouardii]
MSSNLSSSLATSKNASVQLQLPSPSQSQSSSSLGIESQSQRRNGGSGIFGAGSVSRTSPVAARNNQSLRKQHKGQRRPRLADEDAAAESAVMQSTRNRKGQTSITHLMNFVLPPRPQNHPSSHRSRGVRQNPTWGLGSGYHAADKARYIHANYRFIVDPRGDYRAQAVDADVHLDWASVLQILASAKSQTANCPICLSSPVAPRMAKCGHIFCLPCLLRYIHSTDEMGPFPEKRQRWKKCPICWDSIYISETRPVRWFTGQEGDPPQEGRDVVLRLVERQQGSTLALPRDGATSLEVDEDIPWYLAAEIMDYARVMKGGEDYMVGEYDRESEELQQQEREDELMFGEETQWTQRAMSAISEMKGRLKGLGNPPVVPAVPNERKPRRAPLVYHDHPAESPNFHLAQHALTPSRSPSAASPLEAARFKPPQAGASHVEEQGPPSGSDVLLTTRERTPATISEILTPRTTSAGSRSTATHHNTSPFFFYEALLHFYLSPLDIRILKAAFGEFSSFPSTILPRVERVSTGHIVDDELRRRARYLAHLPRGCEVAFLECDWTDVVNAGILSGFSVEIERRRKRNREKEAREEKERVRAEKEEDDKRWAAARRRRPALSPDNFTAVDSPSMATGEGLELASSSVDSGFTSSSPPWRSLRAQAGSAFASLASPSTSPVAPRTVWGTAAVAPSPSVLEPISQEQKLPENDGWLQNWEEDLLREDDISIQLAASSIENSTTNAAALGANGKKKRGKKITLMSTNARRGA